MDIQKEREELFDENFKLKSNDVERIRNFCQELSNLTNVQVCTNNGMLYEYLPQVYNSALKNIK